MDEAFFDKYMDPIHDAVFSSLEKCRALVQKWRTEAANYSSPAGIGFQTRFLLLEHARQLEEMLP